MERRLPDLETIAAVSRWRRMSDQLRQTILWGCIGAVCALLVAAAYAGWPL